MTLTNLHTAFILYYRPMVVAAHHYVKDWQAAEDIAQEAFIKLYKKGKVKSVKDMLFILVRNLSVSYLRKQGIRPDKPVLICEDGYVADGEVMSEAVFIALQKAIERLPGRQRDLLRKMYNEGLSRSDAARALGMDISTAGVHFNRAKGMLKDILKGEYYL